MNVEWFSQQVEAYSQWKAAVAKEVRAYRLWLRRNNLFSPDADMRLYHMLETLRSDYVTIAFAGEFSRGKTELINAIFFAAYGQRILPSQAGRTTMCPTELYYDRDTQQSFLRLLPIETRLSEIPLAEYKHLPGPWVEMPLSCDHPAEMAQAMLSITETKTVSVNDAIKLGFAPEHLDRNEHDANMVEIPAWRHALVSFPHPLLMQGLRVLDTPGLNALGSEPELTLSLLPQAQAVVFVMAADQGVTATDLAIWKEHVSTLKNRPNLGLYAVLNKVDMLWDELDSRKKIEKTLQRVIKNTARHLDLDENAILPVSAKQGLFGKIRDDHSLLLRSHLLDLEKLLAETVLGNRRQLLWERVVAEATQHVDDSMRVMEARREHLRSQIHDLTLIQHQNSQEMTKTVADAMTMQADFRRSLAAVQPSQRLMERQSQQLLEIISNDRLGVIIRRAQQRMELDSFSKTFTNTTVGILRAMREFFQDIDGVMKDLAHHSELSNKMAESIYRKFENEHGLKRFEPRLLPARGFQRRLHNIVNDADQLPQQLKIALNFESVAIRRFFTTTVADITQYLQAIRRELQTWGTTVLMPLNQALASQKTLVEQHVEQLNAIQHSGATAAGRIKALNSLILDIDGEIAQVAHMHDVMKLSAPATERGNIVSFARARR